MEVWIDRLGGDIVRVQLPRYPVSIDKPNDPFLLARSPRGPCLYRTERSCRSRRCRRRRASVRCTKLTHNEFDFRSGGELRLTTLDNSVEIDKVFTFTPDDYVVERRAMTSSINLITRSKRGSLLN